MAEDGRITRMIDLVDSGDVEAVKRGIAKGFNVNERTYTGQTPVFIAIERNDLSILKILINAGARVDVKDGFGTSPLLFAQQLASVDKKYFQTEIITLIQNTLYSYNVNNY